MWEIIRAGGGFMWPIILCSIVSVAIILERLWTLQSSRVIPRDLAQKVWNYRTCQSQQAAGLDGGTSGGRWPPRDP
jgi:biopolymer transport protein ExbB/TolQ